MVLLSPPKLLVILVIALIVLGPDKLPSVARRIGAFWSDFARWRTQLESEVRSTFPDIPSTTEIARAVRSPVSLLDRLAEEHRVTEEHRTPEERGAVSATDPVGPTAGATDVAPSPDEPTSSGHAPETIPAAIRHVRIDVAAAADASPAPDVSSMN